MKLDTVIKERGISKLQVAMKSEVPPHILYNALNGKAQLYPKYRKAISTFLKIPEYELFPEYNQSGGV